MFVARFIECKKKGVNDLEVEWVVERGGTPLIFSTLDQLPITMREAIRESIMVQKQQLQELAIRQQLRTQVGEEISAKAIVTFD